MNEQKTNRADRVDDRAGKKNGVFARVRLLPARVLIALVLGYRGFISPLFPPCCRFVPTCSQYALDAIRKYGAARGALLTLWRLLRCHPFCRGGYDPVK